MKKFNEKLLEFFEDGQYLSAYRLVMNSWCMGVLFVWIYFSILNKRLADVPPSVLTFLMTLVAGKQVQSHIESRVDIDVPPTSPPIPPPTPPS